MNLQMNTKDSQCRQERLRRRNERECQAITAESDEESEVRLSRHRECYREHRAGGKLKRSLQVLFDFFGKQTTGLHTGVGGALGFPPLSLSPPPPSKKKVHVIIDFD